MIKIVIDPGHGGTDSGAVGFDKKLLEKNVNLQIAIEIERQLRKYEVSVSMTRWQDRNLSLGERTDFANMHKCDLFLSIHLNSFSDKKANGFESFVFPNVDKKTLDIQKSIHEEIVKLFPNVRNRGMKKNNFYVLRETKMSAILTECLFISSVKDFNIIKDKNFINNMAKGHVNGIVKYFKLKKKVVDNGKFHRVVCGSFKDKVNAEKRVNELKKKGFESFIIYE